MKTISIENSKRLKELGVDKESEFCWFEYDKMDGNFWQFSEFQNGVDCYGIDVALFSKVACAYTADELGEMLPNAFDTYKLNGAWYCEHISYVEREAETMADAMAECLIWLIENGHVKAEEL